MGLLPHHIRILGRTRDWLRYEVPQHWVKREWRGSYRGQKQIWFLLRLTGRDSDVKLRANEKPEFDACVAAAKKHAVPVREVLRAALVAASS